MYLEKLEIQGFKSFANKNKLIFSNTIDEKGHRGLTSVVGPNGSGKSNIADAVRWVLGEQSLKTLRGKKSEDVIFSGSDQKSQLSMAEVSLFLNNEDRQIAIIQPILENGEEENETDPAGRSLSPLDYDQIIITRRLYRSGESEYLLNGNRVRLADIQILLARANVGQKTYSVIGQGMVENFLNTGASERKDFFDEATGVKQFQIKRDQSLNKLENSYENLRQVEMLLNEIRPRLKMLTRQVDKLKKRSQLEQELSSHQHQYFFHLWQDINEKLNNTNKQLVILEKEQGEKEKELELINTGLEKIKRSDDGSNISELQEKLRVSQNERAVIIRDISRLNAELELQLESQGQFDVAWLNNKHEELKREQEQLTKEIGLLQSQNQSNKEKELRDELQRVAEEISKKEVIKTKNNLRLEEKARLIKQITRLDATLEANLEAQGQFDVAWLNNKQEELRQSLDKLKNEIETINLNEAQSAIKNLEEKRIALDSLITRDNNELQNINRELKINVKPAAGRDEINESIESFLRQLDAIKEEQDLDKIKALIEEAKKEFKKKITTLIDGENSIKLEQAKTLQENIIRNSEERQELIAEINELRLDLSTKQERRRLLEHQEHQSQIEIQDIEAKIAKSQIKFDANKIKEEQSQINQKIKELEDNISEATTSSRTDALINKRQELINELNECRLSINSRHDKIKLFSEKQQQNLKEIKDIQDKIAKSQVKFDANKLEADKKSLNIKLSLLDVDINKWQVELNQYNQDKEEEKRQLFSYQSQIQELQSELNQLSNKTNNYKIEIARQETRLEDLENNINNEEIEIESIKNYQIKNEEEIEDERLRKRINELKNQLELIGGIDPETEKEFIETDERYQFLTKQTDDLSAAIQSLDRVITELDINIKERFEKEFKIISEKFSEYFKILFNGGNAKMFKLETEDANKDADVNLANNDNKEDERYRRLKQLKKYSTSGVGGIEIQATPPGKKIQSISMLSGGERALTAIALICAIISANPSPFVLLDEVDAALDESNSERLAQILDDLSAKTQFITITHNRALMKRASIIYGVTMKADSVSQLLSIRLDEMETFQNKT
ncbi:MAG: AAA family ATPase [Patescibacteria group bacterium]|nr:AAA family ATPase [Patescibacteria group bacterium]